MKLKLNSNFLDFYDHAFDREGEKFSRLTTSGPSRPEMFELFDSVGISTPRYGKALSLLCDNLVIYLDENAHCGEGKIVLPMARAHKLYPDHFASEYIEPFKDGVALSIRMLNIGKRTFRLVYECKTDWRSNCGEIISCEPLSHHYRRHFDFPLYALDYVEDKCGRIYAVDLNIAPGVRNSGVEKYLKPREIVGLLKHYIDCQRRKNANSL